MQARDSTRGVIGSLTAKFFGLSSAFKLFGEASKLSGLAKLAADAGHADAALFLMGQSAQKSGAAFKELALSGLKLMAVLSLVAVAVAVAIGVAAIKAAGDFQQGLNRLVTGAGDVTDNMNLMGQSILGISTDTGVLTDQLLPAMYQIISAGQRGAQAEDTLAVAARGSVAEQAKIVDVAKALTTAMTDYGTKQFNATQFMNGYTRAVQLGKITLEELSQSMGPILPLAKNLGISFADVAAAMSTMTNAGIPAERAATSLRFLFQSIENPTHKAADAMKLWGLNSVALANEMKKSLPGALQMVYDAAKRAGPEGSVPFNRAVSDMIGGQRSLQSFLSLTGGHMKTFEDNAKKIAAAMGISKTAVLGWDTAQKNFNVQLDSGKAVLQGLLITIGLQLMPYIMQIAAAIIPLVSQFAAWFSRSNALSGALKAVSDTIAFMAPAVTFVVGKIAEFVMWGAKLIASLHLSSEAMIALKGVAIAIGIAAVLMMTPILLLAAVVVAAIVGILLAIRYVIIAFNWVKQAGIDAWTWIRTAAMNTWNWIKTAWGNIGAFFSGVWASVKSSATGVWNGLIGFLRGVWETIKGIFKGAIDAIVGVFNWLYVHNSYFQGFVDGIKIASQAVMNWLRAAWTTIVKWIGDKWNTMKTMATTAWNAVKGVFQAVWGWLSGIFNTIWSNISKWWSTTSTNTHKAATDLWTKVKSVFSSAWSTYISGPLGSLANSIGTFFSGLVTKALTWGKNIIQGIIDGIRSMLGALGKAAADAAAAVAGALGFRSPPEVGPASDSDQWAPNFIRMFASGLLSGIPQLASASARLAGAMGSGYSGSYALSGASFAGGRYPSGGTTVVHNHIVVMPPDVKLEGASVVDTTMARAATDVRRHGGPVLRG